jgi:hypothetical protein
MAFPFRRVSIPASQFRLTAAVFSTFTFGVLLYVASDKLEWFTFTRGFLILFGVVGGCLYGLYESRTVIRGLTKKAQIIAWQILPVGVVLFGLPLLLGKLFLADSEFLPFAGYLALPAVPVLSAVSGWRFRQFEKANKVQVFVLFTGYAYYRAPLIVNSNRLYYFIRQVATKDFGSLWAQTGYAGKLIAALKERQDLDSETRQDLLDVLKVMNTFRWIGLTALALFLATTCVVLAPVFTDTTGLTHILTADSFDIIVPASGGIVIGFSVTVFLLLRTFKKKISRMTAEIDLNKLGHI